MKPTPKCPICNEEGRLKYRTPASPLWCKNEHHFANIEGDPRKPPIYAIVSDEVKWRLIPNTTV